MTLFRRDDLPLSIDFVGFEGDELSQLEILVERHGGKIVHDESLPIKFTKPSKFVCEAFPKFKLYDVEFIRECVRKSAIVDPTPYRIGKPMLYDNCVMLHYLKGFYDCCDTKIKKKTEDRSLSKSSMEVPAVRRKPGRPRKHPLQRHTIAGSFFNGKIRASSPDPIIMLSPDDTSDDEITMSVAKRRKGRGKHYTLEEQEDMLRYIINRNMVHKSASGPSFWDRMHREGYSQRQGPSLYHHFKEYILPNIERYQLTEKQLKMFKDLQKAVGTPIKAEKHNQSLLQP